MKIKKVSTPKIILLSLLALIIFILAILFFYLPRYLIRNVTVDLPPSEGEELTIMSTNVRCYAPDDLLKKSLFYRMELIATDVCAVMPDVICFQEMQGLHYNYLEEVMPDYTSVMAFRDNSIIREGCSIFYRTDRFEEIESGHFWLSETPEVKSKDWGSAHYRICVYVCLKDRNTGKEFIVFNTHLDHKSEEARIKGIEVVLDTVHFAELLREADLVITGEGKIDSQSLRGKVICGVAKRSARAGVPVIAIVGDVADDAYSAYDIGVSAIFSINRLAIPRNEAKRRSSKDYARTLDDVLRCWRAAQTIKH